MHEDQVERHQTANEIEHLLSDDDDWMEMADLSPERTREDKYISQVDTRYTDEQSHGDTSESRQVTRDGEEVALANGGEHIEYRVYKIRWFGLTQLILLNIVVSWDVSRSGLRITQHSTTNFLCAVAVVFCSR